METLGPGATAVVLWGQGAGWALRAACYAPRFILDGSGLDGGMPMWDQGDKRERGGGVQSILCTPGVRLGLVGLVCLQDLGSRICFFFAPSACFVLQICKYPWCYYI